MSTDIYLPQGANPLAPLRIQTARCARVDFDRAARSNVLVLDGDISQSRVQMPKEDRPLMSLQLPFPIIGFQLLCPSSGQLAIDLTLSQSAMSRLRVTAATFISKADVTDAKGMPHVKLPFSLPRNVWTQAVLNLPGIVSHLFQLPTPKWIDSIAISGSVRIRRIFGTHDESIALEKPSGMLLFTVPAYGPPVWKGVNRAAPSDVEVAAVSALQQQQQQHGQPFAMRFIRDETGEVRFTAARAGDVLQARVAPDDDADVPPEETDMEDEHGTHRSPRSEAVFQALQRGRQLPLPPDPAHQGRTGSAPPALLHGDEEDASHKASSYRRLVKAQPPTTSATKAPPVSSNPAPSAAADDQSVWGSVVLNGWDDAPTTSSTGTSPSLASAGEAPPLPPGRVATRGGAAGGGVANGAGRGGASPSAPIATVSKKPVAGRGIGNQQRVSPPPVATPSDTGLDLLVKRADAGPAVAEYTFKPKQERVVGYGVGDLEVQHSSGTGSGSDDESDASDDDDDDDDDNT